LKSYKTRRKIVLTVLSICLVLVISAGATVAYLLDRTSNVQNSFEPGRIVIRVNEQFENNVKRDVKIQSVQTSENGSNIDCYIRVAVVINWFKDGQVYGKEPIEGTDYTIVFNDSNYYDEQIPDLKHWKRETDGYWYYDYRVAPGEMTDPLIITCEPLQSSSAPERYTLNVQIIAQAIQADGETDPTQAGGSSKPVVTDVWTHAVNND